MLLYLLIILWILKPGNGAENVTPCPKEWIDGPGSNFCYNLSSSSQTWSGSRSECQSIGGDLLWITDLKEKEWLFDKITQFLNRDGSHQWWIGLNSRSEQKTLVWNDDLNYDDSILDETWLPGQPKFNQTNCGLIWSVVVTMKSCDDVNKYICKRLKDGTGQTQTVATQNVTNPVQTIFSGNCGPLWEWSKKTGSCYQYPEDLLNWFEAKTFCKEQGGVLASINNPQEQFYIAERVHNLPNVYLWLGLNDLTKEGGWEWIDHTPLAYFNWSNGQPDNNGNGEDCGAILTSTGQWSDFPCQNKTAFICKKSGDTTPSTTPLTISKSSTLPEGLIFGCGEDWIAYQDSCYQVLEQEYPWVVARDACKTLEANLVSIENQLENDFILGLMAMYNKSAWIGLNDIEKESVFKWVDNRSVSFTNWGNNQPNNLNGHEDCVYINSQGGWMDYSCFKLLSHSICEKPIPRATSKDILPTGYVITSGTRTQWTSQLATRTYSVRTRNTRQTISTPSISNILHPSPTSEADGLTYRGILGVVALVMVISLLIFAFVLYSCRMVQQGDQREYRAGFENPLYHGDFNEDQQIKVFTLSSDKRVSVTISEENQNGGEKQTNRISVTLERISEVTPEVTSHSDTSNGDISNPSVTLTEIVQYDTPKAVDQRSDRTFAVPNTTSEMAVTRKPEVSEIRSGQILGINQELLDSYKSDSGSSEISSGPTDMLVNVILGEASASSRSIQSQEFPSGNNS